MSVCQKNINKLPFTEEVILDEIKKDLGLLNINNVKTSVSVCPEIFKGPSYTTNLTKLETGLTETSLGVFNLSDNELYFDYVFTGNIDTITAYTGNFEFEVYQRSEDVVTPELTTISGLVTSDTQNFNKRRVHRDVVSFSAITNSGFTGSKIFNFVTSDQEYILNTNFSFSRKECSKSNKYIEPNLKYRYNEDKSFYFVTLSNPSEPTLGPFLPPPEQTPEILTVVRRERPLNQPDEGYVFGVPTKLEEDNQCRLIVEKLTINSPSSNLFSISEVPSPNTLMISVNGITLSTDDYTISNQTIIELTHSLYPDEDVITATYVDCDEDIETVYSEQHEILSAVTSGVTSAVTTTDKTYYNTDQNKYEYYTDYTPDEAENIILYLNGVKLTYGLDFYISTSINNRIIFDSVDLTLNDILYLVYVTEGLDGDYDLITTDTSLEWDTITPTVVNDRLGGQFLLEITESSDTNFVAMNKTELIVPYEDNVTLYSAPIPTTLTANQNYIWRVTSNKVYSGLLGNIFNTYNTSRIGKFYTNNEINSY